MTYDFVANTRSWEKFFVRGIKEVQTQVHPHLSVQDDTLLALDHQIYLLLGYICAAPLARAKDVEEAVRKKMPVDISKWAITEATEALAKYKTKDKSKDAKKNKLVFPVDKLHDKLKKDVFNNSKLDSEIAIYICAVLEYICADVLKLAGNYTGHCKRKQIQPQDVGFAISTDDVLGELFKPLGKQKAKRPDMTYQDLLRDVLGVEEAYNRDLEMLVHVFLEAFENPEAHKAVSKDEPDDADQDIYFEVGGNKSLFSKDQIEQIFSNIREIKEFSNNFIVRLKFAVNNSSDSSIARLFQECALDSEFDCYQEYAESLESAVHALYSVINSDKANKYFEEINLSMPVKHVLPELLKAPVFHLLHYFELVKNFIKAITDKQSPDFTAFREANSSLLQLREAVTREIRSFYDPNTALTSFKMSRHLRTKTNKPELTLLQNRIENMDSPTVLETCAELKYEGPMTRVTLSGKKMRKDKERYCFLFDALFLSCKISTSGTAKSTNGMSMDFQLRERFETSKLSVTDIPDDMYEGGVKNCFELSDGNQKMYLSCRSDADKKKWLVYLTPLACQATLNRILGNRKKMMSAPVMPTLDPKLYRYAEKDSEKNLVFDDKNEEDMEVPRIKCATVEKLVERLTFPTYADTNYVLQFLLTYRSFCTSRELLELLIERYKVPEADIRMMEANQILYKQKFSKPIKLRVFNVLRMWISNHYNDFQEDMEEDKSSRLLKHTLDFIINDMVKEKDMQQVVKTLVKTIRNKRDLSEKQKDIVFASPAPEILWEKTQDPGEFHILTLSPVEIARQMTIAESAIYRSIKPHELSSVNWVKCPEGSPNIIVFTTRFNKTSKWVTCSILAAKNHAERKDIVLKFMEVAHECRRLNNFNGLMEIISGAHNAAVHRLHHTWGDIDKKTKASFDELTDLMNSEKSFKNLREAMHTANPPLIPYFGMYLTDLTFIDDGNKNTVGDHKLINFTKRRYAATVISEAQRYQQQQYNLTPEHNIQRFLEFDPQYCFTDVTLNENAAYKISLELEPRGQDKPNDFDASIRKEIAARKGTVPPVDVAMMEAQKEADRAKRSTAGHDEISLAIDESMAAVEGRATAKPVVATKEKSAAEDATGKRLSQAFPGRSSFTPSRAMSRSNMGATSPQPIGSRSAGNIRERNASQSGSPPGAAMGGAAAPPIPVRRGPSPIASPDPNAPPIPPKSSRRPY